MYKRQGYSSDVNGTYNRQSDSFVLSTAATASGSARFQELSGYYYFLHESNNSKIIIFNIVDGFWSAVFSSGSNFSSPSSGQVVNPISAHNIITPIRTSRDDTGRAYPPSGMGIEYSTVVTQHTSSLGIATAFSLDVTGIVTATSFVGDEVTSTSLVLPEGLVSSGVTTTTTTSESSIDSFSASSYRSAKYQVQITQGSSYHTTEVSIVHDGSDSYGTEYGTVRTGISLASFNTDISGGNVRLLATPASSSSTTFKLVRTLIEL